MSTEKIQIKVNQTGLLKNLRKFFTEEAWPFELLQNAYRSGATLIKISSWRENSPDKTYSLRIQDNGHGMNLEQFHTLFEVMASHWEEEAVERQDPAGAGFFAAACRYEVEVQSRGLAVTVRPDDIVSESSLDVVRKDGDEAQQGVDVIVRGISEDKIITAANAMLEACSHTVYVLGRGDTYMRYDVNLTHSHVVEFTDVDCFELARVRNSYTLSRWGRPSYDNFYDKDCCLERDQYNANTTDLGCRISKDDHTAIWFDQKVYGCQENSIYLTVNYHGKCISIVVHMSGLEPFLSDTTEWDQHYIRLFLQDKNFHIYVFGSVPFECQLPERNTILRTDEFHRYIADKVLQPVLGIVRRWEEYPRPGYCPVPQQWLGVSPDDPYEIQATKNDLFCVDRFQNDRVRYPSQFRVSEHVHGARDDEPVALEEIDVLLDPEKTLFGSEISNVVYYASAPEQPDEEPDDELSQDFRVFHTMFFAHLGLLPMRLKYPAFDTEGKKVSPYNYLRKDAYVRSVVIKFIDTGLTCLPEGVEVPDVVSNVFHDKISVVDVVAEYTIGEGEHTRKKEVSLSHLPMAYTPEEYTHMYVSRGVRSFLHTLCGADTGEEIVFSGTDKEFLYDCVVGMENEDHIVENGQSIDEYMKSLGFDILEGWFQGTSLNKVMVDIRHAVTSCTDTNHDVRVYCDSDKGVVFADGIGGGFNAAMDANGVLSTTKYNSLQEELDEVLAMTSDDVRRNAMQDAFGALPISMRLHYLRNQKKGEQ